ncbi:MAG: sporulation protein YabP [Firmicutes bacterium]|nr:sporulation protein YabP [Bacillota bacterium]
MEEKIHRMALTDRRDLELSGVTEIDSSEDRKILLKTILGPMEIEGQDLRILNLDLEKGCASVGGKIDALLYKEEGVKEKKRSFAPRGGKLFR